MTSYSSSASMLDPDWLRAVATEVHSLCERIFSVGIDAQDSCAQRDAETLLAALDQRERLMRRIEPLLTPLVLVRASIANGTLQDPDLERLVDEIAAWLQSILSATEQLQAAIEKDYHEIGDELHRLSHAVHVQQIYQGKGEGGGGIDVLR
jgi:hypothetical protein